MNDLYGSIVRDPRHLEVTLLDYTEITERRFSNWRMGNVNLNRVNVGSILRFSESPILDPFSMNGRADLQFLEDLVTAAAIASRVGA